MLCFRSPRHTAAALSRHPMEDSRALASWLLLFFSIFLCSLSPCVSLSLLLGLHGRPCFGFEFPVWIHIPGSVPASAQSTCLHTRAARFHGGCRFLPPKKRLPLHVVPHFLGDSVLKAPYTPPVCLPGRQQFGKDLCTRELEVPGPQ